MYFLLTVTPQTYHMSEGGMVYVALGLGTVSVIVAVFSQTLLKTAANQTYHTRLGEYLNPRVISGYGLMVVSALCSMYALRYLSVSTITMMQSANYVLVPIVGLFLFKERISLKQWLGMGLIVIGLIVFSL